MKRLLRSPASNWLFLLLYLTLPSGGQATTVRALDFPDLVQQSEIIADVTVMAVEPYWASPAGGNAVHTLITFSLNSDPWKGQIVSPFVLDFLGGAMGDRKMQVSGMPEFKVGDRVIVFTYGPDKIFASPLIGFDQGAMRVVRDQLSNLDRVYRWWGQPVNELQPFTSRVPASAAKASSPQLSTANSLEEFAQRVSKIIQP